MRDFLRKIFFSRGSARGLIIKKWGQTRILAPSHQIGTEGESNSRCNKENQSET